MMVPERLWAAFRFVSWDDTLRFHARLCRCFLFGLLDAHGELVLSQGSERIWAALGQGLGLVRDAGLLHSHEPVSPRARCPPKRRYDATWSPLTTNAPMDQTVSVPPFVSQPINITRGLHDEPTHSAVASDIGIPGASRCKSYLARRRPVVHLGSGRVLGGYDGFLAGSGVVGYVLLWLFTLAVVLPRSSSSVARARSASTRTVRQLPSVGATTNSRERDCLSDTPEVIDHQASMPGAWLHERLEQSTLTTREESVLDTMPWTLFDTCAQMGIKAWVRISSWTCIMATLDPLDRGSNDVQKYEDGCFLVCQGLGLNALDLDADVSTAAAPNEAEPLGVAPDRLPSEFGPLPGNFEPTTAARNRPESLEMGDVTIRDLDLAQMTTLDVVSGNETELTLASSNADRGSYQEDTSLDGDESASEDGLARCADVSPLERKDAHHVLGRRQDGAMSDTDCPFSLRRARSTGYLRKTRDVFDDDEGTGDDCYWTEQVNARLSGERDFRHVPGRSDGCSWPREGREDESDNWRTRSSQANETDDAVDSSSTKLRRYSSPPLNVNATLSRRAGSGDGPPGIYVVPQKRSGSQCWSPLPSPPPSGLGFFPFRQTPSLLTPDAWRPGCLYISDPPVDESREAEVWWDGLTRGAATGTVIEEQQRPFSRDVQDGPVSWRDRYENDPASKRFISTHRRAMTEG